MQLDNEQDRPFGKVRNFIWPIHNFELKKLFPMFSLFFLISFIYNLLRNLKVPLLIKAAGSCPEAIPFVKVGAVLPGALLLTYIFTLLISRFTREQVFYTILTGFLLYFALFTFVLYPYHESHFQLNGLADYLHSTVLTGEGSKGLVAAIRHFNFVMFYVLSEMWSAVVLSMLFWGFANEVTKVDEAKRFYAIFALGANISGMAAGVFAAFVRQVPYYEALPLMEHNQWIFIQMSVVLIMGVMVIALFYRLNRTVFHLENVQSLQIPKKARKMSLTECFSYLRRSRYLTYMVIIVVGYNLVYNLTDVVWNYKLDQTFATSKDLNAYMSKITFITGAIAVFLAFCVSGNVIRKYGWTAAALITPIIWLLTSMGFFAGLVLEQTTAFEIVNTFFSNPGNLVLILGAIQLCLGRGCKYTVFDEAKEIAFIPLPKENQRKGKAVVDGLASRFGKSGGSLIYIILFGMLGGTANTIPYVTVIIYIALAAWIVAVVRMGKIVEKAISGDTSLTIEEEGILSDQLAARDGPAPTAVPAAG